MGDTVLDTTVKEKDLGVTISSDMKVSEQCGMASSKGNHILVFIWRTITYKGKKQIISLYKAIVRPVCKTGDHIVRGISICLNEYRGKQLK